jgi:hypothetical protein
VGADVPRGTTNPSWVRMSSRPRRQVDDGPHSRGGVVPGAAVGSSPGQGTAKPSRSATRWQLARNARLGGVR